MTREQIVAIGLCYQERFGNIETIGHPKIAFEPRFGELMERAIRANEPLTCLAVAEAFPEYDWDAGWLRKRC